MINVPAGGQLRFHSFWWFQGVGWSCFYLLSILVVSPYIQQPGQLRDQSVMAVCGFVASLALRPVCRSLLPRSLSWTALETRAAAWSALAGTATTFVASLLIVSKPELVELLEGCAKMSVLLFLWCNLYFSIKHWERHAQERERLFGAEAEAHAARLRALRYQLNPHFLFNSLNAVSTLVVEGNAPGATRMLAHIAEFLRMTMDGEVVPEVPLAQEMLLTERYLAIEQARLEGRLRINLAISPDTFDALVPSLLLQPLVENAVRHGVALLVEGGTVAIRSELRNSRVHISVTNSGHCNKHSDPNTSPQAAGIGLTNTAERLRTLYGIDHRFALEWPATGGCQAVVELPFRTAGQGLGATACAY
jgi:two-component system, LytTR family, sensor kinase